MFSNYITITALLAFTTSAAPIVKRDTCQEGLFNCTDGTHYAQCVAGGTWSATISVAPGTTCNVGISANPFLPSGSGSPAPSPAPVPAPAVSSNPSKAVVPSPASGSDPSDCGGFPCQSSWDDWATMRAKYEPIMGSATQCMPEWGAPNTAEETSQVLDAISSLSGSVDPRFVLAIMMQESRGCVRVVTTSNSVQNPGLLQDYNGSHSCHGLPVPCPQDQIQGMITDGISGGDDNLSKALATATAAGYKDAFAYAVAARIYNSGNFDPNNLNNGFSATSGYVKQVMARLAKGAPVS